MSLQRADTADVDPLVYRYDAWRTDDGSNRVLAIGLFNIQRVART